MTTTPTTVTPSTALTTAVQSTQMVAPGLLGSIGLSESLSKQDLVAIVRQHAEDALGGQMQDLQAQLKLEQGKLPKIEEQLEKLQVQARKKVSTAAAEKLVAAYKAFNGKSLKVEVGPGSRLENEKVFQFDITVTAPPSYASGSRVTEAEAVEKIPFTSEAIDIVANKSKVIDAISKIQNEMLQIKRKLANLPSLERKAHAMLAETALASTAQGREVLDRLLAVSQPPTE